MARVSVFSPSARENRGVRVENCSRGRDGEDAHLRGPGGGGGEERPR